MSQSEQSYCITRKELLAVYTFTMQFRHYLLGRRFKIRTDHKALVWIMNWERPNTSQYCRWVAELSQFDFEIIHRKGKLHGNADFLSRAVECKQCEILHENPKEKRNVKCLRQICDNDNQDLLRFYHEELGHVGVTKMHERLLSDGYKWSGMKKDAITFVRNCASCKERKNCGKRNKVLKKIIASHPFEKVMFDIAGPIMPSKKGYRYFLLIVDVFSRFPMIIPLKKIDSKNVMNAIFYKWVAIFGFPEIFISDNAPNLNAEVFLNVCKYFQIIKDTSSPYHPEGNGIVERMIQTVKDRIYATSKNRNIDWVDAIPSVELGLRATTNAATGYTPNEIVFGYKINLPFQQNTDCGYEPMSPDVDNYISNLRNSLEKIWDVVSLRNVNVEYVPRFCLGEKVMVKKKNSRGLLKERYFGPCY